MTRDVHSHSSKTQLKKMTSRRGRRSAGRKAAQIHLRLERLEERRVLAGFGPDDGAYIVEPWIGSYRDVKIQPADQKIVAAGSITLNPTTTSDPSVVLARYDSSGNSDVSFGNGGSSVPGAGIGASGLVLQPDGKAVVSAAQANSGYFGAARFNANGSLDSSFGDGGFSGVNTRSASTVPPGFGQKPTDVGLQSSGKIVVGGWTVESFPDARTRSANLARFKTNGATDSGTSGFGDVVNGKATGYTRESFNATFAIFTDIAIQSDDKVVASGALSPTGSASYQWIVARYTAAGILDITFNGSGYSVLTLPGISNSPGGSGAGVALQADGKIVVVSSSNGIDGASDILVARYNTNGSLDTTFAGGSGFVRLDIDGTASPTYEYSSDVTIQPDGKIIVVGKESISKGVVVARLNADGSPDATFGSGGIKVAAPPTGTGYSFDVYSVALQLDGDIIVAGGRTSDVTTPLLMRFFGERAAIVTPMTGLRTGESGGQAAFTVSLNVQPTADITIPISSSDMSEGSVSTSSLVFNASNWNIPQTVTITGVDDALVDGDIAYSIVLGPATSADSLYNGLDPANVSVTNTDDDTPPTKFYVVNDATTNFTYEYGATGSSVENYALNSGNSAPRGAASSQAGDKVWVIDANKNVYIYNTSGGLLGSWSAGSLPSNATVEGITTNGTDVWIVDSRSDKVYKYAGAASRTAGSQNATSSFSLNGGNTSPTDLVTDGSSFWVLNNTSSTDKVFKYTVDGSPVGSWTISSGGGSPTGITIDPSNVSNIWIVDNNTDRVYQFDTAASRTSGSQSPSFSFALATGNTNPQGIADPPPPSASLNTTPEAAVSHSSSSIAFMQAPIVLLGASSIERASLRSTLAVNEGVDQFMSRLASALPAEPTRVSKAQSIPVLSRPRFAADQNIDLALADEELSESLDSIANDLPESTIR